MTSYSNYELAKKIPKIITIIIFGGLLIATSLPTREKLFYFCDAGQKTSLKESRVKST